MTEAVGRTRDQLEAQIVARAWSDEAFLERLKADPHAAVAEETGVSIPGSVGIEVLEETPEHAYLVIPPNRVAISEEQLEAASGGEGFDNWYT